MYTVRSDSSSRAYCGPALRPWLLQADLVHFQVSTWCLILHNEYHLTRTSAVFVAATVVTAECKEFWQLLLCQGLLTGSCCGMIFGPVPAIASQWFKKRRSLVFGIAAAGASLGGIVIPIATSNLIGLVGYVERLCTQ